MNNRDRDREDKNIGPTWRDVYEYAEAMERFHQQPIMFETRLSKAPNGAWGLRVRAFCPDLNYAEGYGSYGSGHRTHGQGTMSGAYFHALMQLEEVLSQRPMMSLLKEAEGRNTA